MQDKPVERWEADTFSASLRGWRYEQLANKARVRFRVAVQAVMVDSVLLRRYVGGH